MKLVFFRTPKPRRFDYKPLYYDKEKEEREQRKKELGIIDSTDHMDKFKADLQRKWRYERQAKKQRTSELRTVIYVMIVGFFVYLIFFTDFVQKIVLFFSS